MTARIFYDSEFDEDGRTIEPLSLGFFMPCWQCNASGSHPRNTRQVCWLCAGKCYYGLYVVITDADRERGNSFVQAHVIPYLDNEPDDERVQVVRCTRAEAGLEILNWIRDLVPVGERLEFWAYFGSYDWVLLCQLFGNMTDLPIRFPHLCQDLKQELMRRGYMSKSQIPEKLSEGLDIHNSYDDALWNYRVYEWLKKA